MIPYTVQQVIQKMTENDDLIILDCRSEESMAEGFIPGSICIELNDRFEDWATSLLPVENNYLLVAAPGKEEEAILRMNKAGINSIAGYLENGFSNWKQAGESIDLVIQVEPDELAMDIPFDENLLVLDVRNEAEFADGHVKNALNIPLKTMIDPGVMAILDEKNNLYVHGRSGYQSFIAASLLKRQGFHNLRNIVGGWEALIQEKRIDIEKEKSALN
jgi:hydroxyacylglutathione hydrolase